MPSLGIKASQASVIGGLILFKVKSAIDSCSYSKDKNKIVFNVITSSAMALFLAKHHKRQGKIL